MKPEKTELLTFEDILEREGYAICDASIISPSNLNWYWEGVYRARNFSGINSEYVEGEAEYLKYFIEFLQNQNVFVARGVSLQIQRARYMVADKIKYLKMREKKDRDWKHQNGENKINLLQEVHDLFHSSFRETKRVSFLPKQRQKYNDLERIVMSVTEQTRAKVDLDEVYEQRAKPKRVQDFHADEQTVAAALYLSIIENRKGCILTRNLNIERILTNTLSYFFYSGNSQFNNFFSITRENEIRIYFVSDFQQVSFIFDSSNFYPSSKISKEVVANIDEEKNRNYLY